MEMLRTVMEMGRLRHERTYVSFTAASSLLHSRPPPPPPLLFGSCRLGGGEDPPPTALALLLTLEDSAASINEDSLSRRSFAPLLLNHARASATE